MEKTKNDMLSKDNSEKGFPNDGTNLAPLEDVFKGKSPKKVDLMSRMEKQIDEAN